MGVDEAAFSATTGPRLERCTERSWPSSSPTSPAALVVTLRLWPLALWRLCPPPPGCGGGGCCCEWVKESLDEVLSRDVTHWMTTALKRTVVGWEGVSFGGDEGTGEDGLSLLQHMRQTQPGSPSRAMRTERFLEEQRAVSSGCGGLERWDIHDAADEGADAADKCAGGDGPEAAVAFGLLHVSEGV